MDSTRYDFLEYLRSLAIVAHEEHGLEWSFARQLYQEAKQRYLDLGRVDGDAVRALQLWARGEVRPICNNTQAMKH